MCDNGREGPLILFSFAHFCSLFMLTFCSRFSHVFCSRFCSSFAQLYTDLLNVCSFYAHFWLIFYSLSTTRLIADSLMDHAETKNHCFLCSLNGQPPTECAIVAADGKTYLNRHRKKKNAVVCEWFDSKFPAGNGEREGLQSEATRVKKQAVQNCLRAKKRLTRAAGETG